MLVCRSLSLLTSQSPNNCIQRPSEKQATSVECAGGDKLKQRGQFKSQDRFVHKPRARRNNRFQLEPVNKRAAAFIRNKRRIGFRKEWSENAAAGAFIAGLLGLRVCSHSAHQRRNSGQLGPSRILGMATCKLKVYLCFLLASQMIIQSA